MSSAPENKASMAEGPALKLVHCIRAAEPKALAKDPFALPTMACAWVILGNAPTRIAVCPRDGTETRSTTKPNPRMYRFIIPALVRSSRATADNLIHFAH